MPSSCWKGWRDGLARGLVVVPAPAMWGVLYLSVGAVVVMVESTEHDRARLTTRSSAQRNPRRSQRDPNHRERPGVFSYYSRGSAATRGARSRSLDLEPGLLCVCGMLPAAA